MKTMRHLYISMLATLVALAVLCGCATNTTVQRDISYENGKPVRETVTTTKAKTFYESKSSLANFKATQTDKSQSTSIGSLASEASSTNATAQLEAIARLIVALRPSP